MIKKYCHLFIIGLFFIIFSSIYGGEYFDFHEKRKKLTLEQYESHKLIENFSLEDIQNIKDIQLIYTPDLSFLDTLIQEIENAQKLVYIEVYMLTEKRIQKSLKKAHNNGVDIKVILERNPYMAYNINNKAASFLKESGIDFVWSQPDHYSLNHSKLILIDESAYISTGNLSYSTFTKNRDIFVRLDDPFLYQTLKEIFLSSYYGEKRNIYNSNLVLSPFYSRKKIQTLINSAKNKIHIYIPYLQDDSINDLLLKKRKSGVDIKIIVDKKSFDSNKEVIQNMVNTGIDISYLEQNKMHSKAILVDKKYLFIGSVNFSTYSFDENKEIGILVKEENIIQDFLDTFLGEKHVPFS